MIKKSRSIICLDEIFYNPFALTSAIYTLFSQNLCWPDDECKFEIPSALANYKAWVMNMLQVDAVKSYGLPAEHHKAFVDEMVKHSKGEKFTYDFLL